MQRKVADAIRAARHTGMPQYTGFLNDREQQLALAELHKQGWKRHAFCGGYEGAERSMLCVFEDKAEPFPLVCLYIHMAEKDTTRTHRDYLGALLALGIHREAVGDIKADDKGAHVFVKAALAVFLQQELRKVGRCKVTEVEKMGEVAFADEKEDADVLEKGNVASLRLDAVLAEMMGISRAKATTFIAAGKVQVNHLAVDSSHYEVAAGDVFSIRGEGKWRFTGIGGKSRKNRIWIEYQKY